MYKYNIYNLAVINLKTSNGKYLRYFDNEYLKMQTRPKKEADPIKINLVIGPLPERSKGDLYGKKKFKKLFTFEYIVRNLDGLTTEIYFSEHFIDKLYINAVGVYVQAQILEPVMYYKLLQKGVVFLHAAGVEKGGKGYLLPAYGGTGKTTLSLKLLARGYRLLGDDLLLVDTKSNQVYAYPRPFHLFTYNINSLEGAKVPLKYRAIINVKNILRWVLEKITREEFLISTRVHADELYGGNIWADVVPYRFIRFLKKEGGHETFSLRTDSDRKRHAQRIIASADLNKSLMENVFEDSLSKKAFAQKELEVVTELLKPLETISYVNTRKLSDEDLKLYFQAVER